MKKCILAGAAMVLLLLSACGVAVEKDDGKLHIVATTYPVYLLATAVTEGADHVEVALMVSEPTACLHDYTLTVSDMKVLDRADVVIMNGAELEGFMADALAQSRAEIIDCSEGIDLLLSEEHEGHDGHDHAEEYDPHYWLDPGRAGKMVDNIMQGLSRIDREQAERYQGNAAAAGDALVDLNLTFQASFDGTYGVPPTHRELITFHDGFGYLADTYGLDILKAIEEEAGSEASAKELVEVTGLIRTHNIPAIFTEVNGSEATAKAVQRETGVDIYRLNMIMSGDGVGIQPYIDAMNANIGTILEALK